MPDHSTASDIHEVSPLHFWELPITMSSANKNPTAKNYVLKIYQYTRRKAMIEPQRARRSRIHSPQTSTVPQTTAKQKKTPPKVVSSRKIAVVVVGSKGSNSYIQEKKEESNLSAQPHQS
jgi:hypothetical protein